MLSDSAVVETESRCRAVLMRYAVCVDRRDWAGVVALFAKDAVWRRPQQPPLVGRAQILEFFETLDRRRRLETPQGHLQRHLFTTVSIEPEGADTARGVAYAIVFRDEQYDGATVSEMRAPEVLVQYDDLFRRIDGCWLIAAHDSAHIFRASGYVPRLTPGAVA